MRPDCACASLFVADNGRRKYGFCLNSIGELVGGWVLFSMGGSECVDSAWAFGAVSYQAEQESAEEYRIYYLQEKIWLMALSELEYL